MTHIDIYLRLFKYNYKKYRLLFLSNTAIVAVCYFFTSLLTNKEFMDAGLVDPMISSNVYLPASMTFAFSAFFIMYSHISFNMNKEKTYGIFETIGLDIKEIRKMILLENSVTAIMATVVGLMVGTLLSLLFLTIIREIIGLHSMSIMLCLQSYKLTVVFLVVVYMAAILYPTISIPRKTIRKLLEEERLIRINHSDNRVLFFSGLTLITIVVIYLIGFFDQNHSNNMMWCYLIVAIALLVVLFNSLWIIECISKHNKLFYLQNVVLLSNIKYKFSSDRRVILFSVILIGMIMFFQTFSVSTIKLGDIDVQSDNPFQIVYYEYEGSNVPTNTQIQQIAKENSISLATNEKVTYFYDDSQQFAIFSADSLEEFVGKKVSINRGECITYSQYRLYDGYPHYETIDDEFVIISNSEFQDDYRIRKIQYDTLINDAALDTDYCVLINADDYKNLLSNIEKLPHSTIRVINCDNPSQASKLCQELCGQYPDLCEDGISEKAFEEEKNKQSGAFLLLLISIMNILFFALNLVLVHFKMESSLNAFQNKYLNMWKIGFTKDEIEKSLKQYTNYLFVAPTIIAVLMGGFFSVSLMRLSLLARYTVAIGSMIGACMILIQLIISKFYAKRYMNKILD